MPKLKIKKGDSVVVISGRDKGRTGEVFRVFPEEGRLIVQGVHGAERRPPLGRNHRQVKGWPGRACTNSMRRPYARRSCKSSGTRPPCKCRASKRSWSIWVSARRSRTARKRRRQRPT